MELGAFVKETLNQIKQNTTDAYISEIHFEITINPRLDTIEVLSIENKDVNVNAAPRLVFDAKIKVND